MPTIDEALKALRETEKKGFTQSVDVVINIKNVDLKKPENKFSKRVVLPHGKGKDTDICVISDKSDINRQYIESLETDKREAKRFTKKYDFFVCEAPLMPVVGKLLGRYLAPKGKMPELLPPGRSPDTMVGEMKRSVRIRLRDSPSIQIMIGTEKMEDRQIKENVERVVEETKKSLTGKAAIRNAYIKFTMSKPVKIAV